MTDGSKEVILVDKEVVKKDPVAVAANNGLSTELTPSTYAEPTTAEPTTEESTTLDTTAEPSTAEPSTEEATSVTQPVTKKISSTSDTPDTSDNGNNNNANAAVQTGEAPLAVVILTLLIGSTCVMFVLRKKEEIL